MLRRRSKLIPLEDRGPLRVMFCITSMPVGGAETLLVNLIRRLDRASFTPELCCLKELGPLGEVMAAEVPAFQNLIHSKRDVLVLRRLTRLLRSRRIDALITVGAGDKMFWGRLAAWRAGVPVVASALHSTGWPDGVGRLNRLLTPITDAFIGVAGSHGQHLIHNERFPASKVHVIPNGVDTNRFCPRREAAALKQTLGIPGDAPVVGIVAALRPEKNHELFLRAAARLHQETPVHFVIVGDGPERPKLEAITTKLGIGHKVQFLGTRSDIPQLVSMIDVFALTSLMEASPVSILEAMSCGKPVVATNVGSISENVAEGITGYLVPSGNEQQLTSRLHRLIVDPTAARRMGEAGRAHVLHCASLEVMVRGYEELISSIYRSKTSATGTKAEPKNVVAPQAATCQTSA